MYRHHSNALKQEVINLYQQGYGGTTIGKKLGVHKSIIIRWINRYNQFGEQIFEKQPNVRATPEFKAEVVREVLEKHLSCEHVALRNGVSLSAVKSWIRLVRSNGYSSLSKIKPRGRPPKDM